MCQIQTTKEQDEAILRIVKEWLTGCTYAINKQDDCEECTKAMLEALKKVVK